ncbi:MAG TPA: aromatic ring-hydroxylating dioxygenase subunit alpha [Dehalococcoidia bacterium]|nr:aromatic ring-hydroxylating dioxygenase subunit alpha [Dehalococcoidia bacterium]
MAVDLGDLVREDAVHRELFLNPQIFAAEMAGIFERTWVYLAHESEIAQPGEYRTTWIGLNPVIVTRDDADRVRVFFNRCTHRASVICRAERGRTKVFQCPYHGWTFRNTGELTGVSFPGGYGEAFDRRRLDLVEVPRVASYRGFIFASLTADVPSLENHLAGAKAYIDRFIDCSPEGDLVVRSGSHKYYYHGNWKLQVENSLDGYHPNFVHRSYYDVTQRRSGSRMQAFTDDSPSVTKDLGNGHACLDQSAAMGDQIYNRIKMAPGGAEIVAALEREHGPERAKTIVSSSGGVGFNLAVYPNLILIAAQIRVVRPVAVDRTEVFLYPTKLKGLPDGLNNLRLRNHEAFYGPAGFGAPDDLEIFQRVQVGLQARPVEWLELSRGLWREYAEGAITVGRISDETPQRAQHQQWRRLMAGTLVEGVALGERAPVVARGS